MKFQNLSVKRLFGWVAMESLPKMERIKKRLLLQMLFYKTAPLPNMIKMAI